MTTNDQDIAWACLPSYSRELARNMYKTSHDGNVKFLLENLYGTDNLTSDTEPEEILFYPRKDVQEFYAEICKTIDRSQDTNVRICSQGKIIALKSLFGNKCRPDKNEPNSPNLSNSCKIGKDKQPKPKFEIGQLVRCLEDWVQGDPLKIINYDAEDNTYLLDGLTGFWLEESQLEPYTEENKETMEEKELNLCELLKGCEKHKFYSPMLGDAFIVQIRETSIHIVPCDEEHSEWFLFIDKCGIWTKGGQCILYPSRALYEKYPLDAYSAWMEWKESRKPKFTFVVKSFIGKENSVGNCVINEHFIFDSQEEAEQAAKLVKDTLLKFHENKLK